MSIWQTGSYGKPTMANRLWQTDYDKLAYGKLVYGKTSYFQQSWDGLIEFALKSSIMYVSFVGKVLVMVYSVIS